MGDRVTKFVLQMVGPSAASDPVDDPPKILVVEDDADVRDLEMWTLSDGGFEVSGVASGLDVLNAVKREHPSLVLLDFMLPGKDGNAVLDELQQDQATTDVPVIVLSAFPRQLKRTPQVKRVMSKPFNLDELVRVIEAEVPHEASP